MISYNQICLLVRLPLDGSMTQSTEEERAFKLIKVPIVSMNVTGDFFPSEQKKYLVISG